MNLFVASLLASATMAHSGLRVNVTEGGQTLGSYSFTEEKTKLMSFLELLKESAVGEDFCDSNAVKDDDEMCDVATLPIEALPKNDTGVVDFESLEKVFHFTTLTAHSNHKLPMPLTERFSQTQVSAGDEKIDMPADIKKFFQYTVVDKYDAQEAAINDEDAKYEQHAAVSGKYGSLNIPNFGRDDEFLNEGNQYDPETVNNPRELIRLLKAARYLGYDVLDKYASAKLATLFSLNTIWRTRALLGQPPNGEYTLEGWEQFKADTPWLGWKERKEGEMPWLEDKPTEYTNVVDAYKQENVLEAYKQEKIAYETAPVEDVKREESAKANEMIPDMENN